MMEGNLQDQINGLQSEIQYLQGNNWNSTLLDEKDGFYITYTWPSAIMSDVALTIDFTAKTFEFTKTISADNLPFFICRHPSEIMWIAESHIVAGTDGGAVTLDIEKLTGTQAPGAGVSVLATTFNMKGTKNTVVQKEGRDLSTNRQIKQGERLAFKFAGTKTALAGVQVTLYLKFLSRGNYK